VYHLLLFFHVLPANQLTITGVALGHKKLGRPCFEVFTSNGQATHSSRKEPYLNFLNSSRQRESGIFKITLKEDVLGGS